jgi:ATP-dependent exoDNAse (exonuclease V) alpha subunit
MKMLRLQFPVKLAFALTINKSQGQSLDIVGIDLSSDVFGHGQLYVALSRTTTPARLAVLLPNDVPGTARTTLNVVYRQVVQS